MNHLDLCSGIGGFALAARWMGWETIAFCERDKFCQKVLKKHWPEVDIHNDLNTLTRNKVEQMMGMRRSKKYDEAARLYQEGFSIGEIAGEFKISRQAMWKIIKRRVGELRPNLRYGEANHFFRGTSDDDEAQNKIEQALIAGEITRPEACETCGQSRTHKDGRSGIHAHHPDYNKPLEVMWLCQPCHYSWHKNNKAIPKKKEVQEVANSHCLVDILTAGYP